MSSRGKFYMTTAIAYTSGKPHIGNTYEIVLADAIARFKRQQGYDVYFQTGTDEHGQKIQEKAEAENITPKEHVDKIAAEVKRIWDLMNTSYDNFVRTTDADHEAQVQKIFKKLYDKGDTGISVCVIPDLCNVIRQRIQPHIHDMLRVEIHRNPPAKRCPRYAQILQPRKQKIVHHLVFAGRRLNKLRMRMNMLDQPVGIFAHFKEVRLFFCGLYFTPAIRAFAVCQL